MKDSSKAEATVGETQKLVSEYWARNPDTRVVGWQAHPRIRRWINTRISGDPNAGMVKYFKARWFPDPAANALTIGCGFGVFERAAVQENIVARIEGVDISEGAVASCREAVKEDYEDRISYRVADCNALTLPEQHYDAVFGMSSIHHVSELERLYEQVARSLKPKGLFCISEYVGPTRFQSNRLIQRYINGFLRLLPETQRRYVKNPASIKDRWEPPSLEWFEKNDPSEAVRSEEILPLLEEFFEIMDLRPFGGAILHHLLAGIAGNLDETEPEDCAYLDIVMSAEERLEQAGIIDSDFVIVVCRPRPA